MYELFSIFLALFLLAIPTIIIVLIVVALIKKGNNDKKGDSFAKIIKTIYTYIVLTAFLLMTIFGVVSAFDSAINYFIPDEETSYYKIEDDELSKLQRDNELENAKNSCIASFATSLSLLCISVPMFICYSKTAKEIDK